MSPNALVVSALVVQKHCATRVDAYVPACGGSADRASSHALDAWFSICREYADVYKSSW